MPAFAILAGLFGVITTILWLVIGWRAMKAHEELAAHSAHIRDDLRRIAEARSSDKKIL